MKSARNALAFEPCGHLSSKSESLHTPIMCTLYLFQKYGGQKWWSQFERQCFSARDCKATTEGLDDKEREKGVFTRSR